MPLDQGVSLIIDLSRLTYCDSTGISILVGADHQAKASGATLVLACVNAYIARIFHVIGLDPRFSPVRPPSTPPPAPCTSDESGR